MAPVAGGSESVINESSLTPISDEASEQAFSNKRIREDVSQNDVSSSEPECVSNPCADICHDSDAGTTLDSVHNSADALGPDLPVYSADVETNVNNRLIEEVVRAPANVHPMGVRGINPACDQYAA
ncbi:hypothetical protein V6N11_051551 [Hibiscus sabdariffa]|uniref:Uncharacterized protein n=1 Tax=Hibiscus sabdariffa TaxID=183260 RepID=A0ABR2U7F4_9ROSI